MKTQSLHNKLVEWRHDFHMHPETGFEEKRTSSRVAELLKEFGLEVHQGVGKTGVIGILKKGSGNKSIGIRADMDALPINEKNTFNYISKNEGRMHACGHDGHTTMLLGAAKSLVDHGQFNGTVYFIFQPNEEHGLGAQAMIDDGLFNNFSIDEVYGMHNIPGMDTKTFSTRVGVITASENIFHISINGQGGHAALPHMGVDVIMVGAQIINALQTIVSRKLNPALNGVVSVTEFKSDGKRNILPGKAVISGDTRALSHETNKLIEKSMRKIVQGICEAHGVQFEVSYKTEFPMTINSNQQTQAAVNVAKRLVGENKVNGEGEPILFSEDFSHMSSTRPGCFVLIGNGMKNNNAKPLHSNNYDFNDDILVTGSSFWFNLVEQQLV
jgi:hippurate hydrolase